MNNPKTDLRTVKQSLKDVQDDLEAARHGIKIFDRELYSKFKRDLAFYVIVGYLVCFLLGVASARV